MELADKGEERMTRQDTEDFRVVKLFCMTIMVDMSHYTFVKTHRM